MPRPTAKKIKRPLLTTMKSPSNKGEIKPFLLEVCKSFEGFEKRDLARMGREIEQMRMSKELHKPSKPTQEDLILFRHLGKTAGVVQAAELMSKTHEKFPKEFLAEVDSTIKHLTAAEEREGRRAAMEGLLSALVFSKKKQLVQHVEKKSKGSGNAAEIARKAINEYG
ncbi:MAG: hypothetical protein ACE5DI_02830 [Candidatus Micrarchaeia archaeon]